MRLGLGLSIAGQSVGGAIVAPDIYAVDGVSPTLVADFLNGYYRLNGEVSTFDDVFNFTRATIADRTNSDGLTASVTTGTPRLNSYQYNEASGLFERQGLRIEDVASTNLAEKSIDQSGADWGPQNSTTTLVSGGPRGGTWTRMLELATSASHGIVMGDDNRFPTVSGDKYTITAKVQPIGRRYISVTYSTTGFGSIQYATFDTQTNTVSASAGGAAGRIWQYDADTWYVSYTATATSTNATQPLCLIITSLTSSGRAPSFVGDPARGFFITDIMLERSDGWSSHIVTNTSDVIRNLEFVEVKAAAIPWSADGITIVSDFQAVGAGGHPVEWGLGASDFIRQSYNTTNFSVRSEADSVIDDVTLGSFTPSYTYGAYHKIASRHSPTDVNAAVDGVAGVANTTVSAMPDPRTTPMQLMSGGLGHMRVFRVFDVPLTNAQLEEATT